MSEVERRETGNSVVEVHADLSKHSATPDAPLFSYASSCKENSLPVAGSSCSPCRRCCQSRIQSNQCASSVYICFCHRWVLEGRDGGVATSTDTQRSTGRQRNAELKALNDELAKLQKAKRAVETARDDLTRRQTKYHGTIVQVVGASKLLLLHMLAACACKGCRQSDMHVILCMDATIG